MDAWWWFVMLGWFVGWKRDEYSPGVVTKEKQNDQEAQRRYTRMERRVKNEVWKMVYFKT